MKPETFGEYTATITNLQDKEDRFVKRGVGYSIHYGFGHFTLNEIQGANNPVGDAVVIVIAVGTFMMLPGLFIIGFGVYRKFRRGKLERPIE